MKRLRCDRCGNLLALENEHCSGCGSRLAFVPELLELRAWDAEPAPPDSDARAQRIEGFDYRLCANYRGHNICNWAVADSESQPLCRSCRLTRVIPDLTIPENLSRWYRLEAAKRRLIVNLLALDLPLPEHVDEPNALQFQFLADAPGQMPEGAVMTGHSEGMITVNLAEADDAERERRRVAMHEPYRTLLGHFRHEVGHWYWDRLLRDSPAPLRRFRSLFGDERADYTQALALHYAQGPAPDWRQRYISAYAGAHPWEDWAETWAHYLHMVDSLETAFEAGLALRPRRRGEPAFNSPRGSIATQLAFPRMLSRWFSLTYVLNDLNRSLGLNHAYPFVLMPTVVAKLRFVHELVTGRPWAVDDSPAERDRDLLDAGMSTADPPCPPCAPTSP